MTTVVPNGGSDGSRVHGRRYPKFHQPEQKRNDLLERIKAEVGAMSKEEVAAALEKLREDLRRRPELRRERARAAAKLRRARDRSLETLIRVRERELGLAERELVRSEHGYWFWRPITQKENR